jgi:arylsulfatase A-like enzyme
VSERPNVLFIVIDQLRADCVFGALADYVRLPSIRALAECGTAFLNHYSVTAPCGPSRASLLTGRYAMNHRSIRNGTPLRAGIENVATEARKVGYEPLLFGYTDTSADPRTLEAGDPRLFSYEELAPGFTEICRMRQESDVSEWLTHLAGLGIDAPDYPDTYIPAGDTPDAPAIYPAEASDTAYLADRVMEHLGEAAPGWFAHVCFVRPHPPFVAPAPYNKMYPPDDLASPLSAAGFAAHPFHAPARAHSTISTRVEGFPDFADTDANVRLLRAIYFGLATEVDHHVGRILNWLKDSGQFEETLIVLTSDHGDMLGDHGLWGKMTYQDAAFHVPLVVKAPGNVCQPAVTAPTESVDVTPTILDLIGADRPDGMDGNSLRGFLEGGVTEGWKTHSYSELDVADPVKPTPWQVALGVTVDTGNLAILRDGADRLVQFAADLPPVLFNVESDGTPSDPLPEIGNERKFLDLSRKMLCHRMVHAEGTFSRTMITSEGVRRVAS